MQGRLARAVINPLCRALFFCALATTAPAIANGAVINEILFDPAGIDTGTEWIEIYNPADTLADLSGWQLYPDGAGYFSFPASFTIAAKGFVLVHLRTNGTNTSKDLYHSSASANMGNTSGSAALFSGEPRGKDTMKSFVQWGRAGETWESDAEKAGLWVKGEFIDLASFVEPNTIALRDDGASAGEKEAWRVATNQTTGASNSGSQGTTTIPATSGGESSVAVGIVSVIPPTPSIKAYAGVDRMVIAGVATIFEGEAVGLLDQPIENARFSWNFGDGVTAEGKSVTHNFRVPGTYIAVLHVSSGTYAASDYVTITVIPNQISISEVVVGDTGFIRILNQADYTADIGGWMIEDDREKRFVVPSHTMIGARSEIALANSITGLAPSNFIFAYYPDGSRAQEWHKEKVVVALPRQNEERVIASLSPSSSGGRIAEGDKEINEEIVDRGSSKEETRALSENENAIAARTFLSGKEDGIAASGNFFFMLAVMMSVTVSAGFFVIRRFFI